MLGVLNSYGIIINTNSKKKDDTTRATRNEHVYIPIYVLYTSGIRYRLVINKARYFGSSFFFLLPSGNP